MKRVALVIIPVILMAVSITICLVRDSHAAETEDIKPYIESVEHAQKGMTLWQMMKTGGLIMIVLAFVSIGAVSVIVYNLMTLKVDEVAPREFASEVVQKLERGESVEQLCESNDNIISNMVMAGVRNKHKGPGAAREAIESCEREKLERLWQTIGYLSDIASISPLIGLLGTVLGMIKAFNVIAFQSAVVKPIMLAGGVSQAMVTTAGGLIIAIPAMLFYAYFKTKVQDVASVAESYRPDLVKIIEQSSSLG